MKYEHLTGDDIEYIKDNVNNIDRLLLFIDTLLEDTANDAYDTGYSVGELIGWTDCYDTYYMED